MPKRVPPVPWKVGRRKAARPGPSGGGPGGCSGGPGGGGSAGGAGGGAATVRWRTGLAPDAGLRKNDGRPAGSCPSTIRPDYGRKRRGESTFASQLLTISHP